MVQWLRLHTPSGLVSLLDQETRSHVLQLRVCMLQLKILSASAKTQCSQINKYKKKSGPRISIAIFFKDTQMFNKYVKRCSNTCSTLYVCMLSCFSPRLILCNPMDCSLEVSCPWDSPGKNIGVGCCALLQGIFPAQVSNPCLLHLLHWQCVFFTTSTTWEAQH